MKWLSRSTPERRLNAEVGLPIVLGTDCGAIREENQDRVAVMRVNSTSGSSRPFVIAALVDGMGGMVDGNHCAVRALAAFLNATIRLRHELPENRLSLAAKVASRPTADQLAAKFEDICYMASDRVEGRVNNFIQNGYSGFIVGNDIKAFFSKESLYGGKKLEANMRVCFSGFDGSPHPRAHPVVILND